MNTSDFRSTQLTKTIDILIKIAVLWCCIFGLLNFYWAIGGTVGEGTIGVALESQIHTLQMVVLLSLAGLVKIVLGFFLLTFRKSPYSQNSLKVLGLGLVALMLLFYAVYNVWMTGKMLLDFSPIPQSLGENAFWWHLFFWNPVWILGAVLFSIISLHFFKRQFFKIQRP